MVTADDIKSVESRDQRHRRRKYADMYIDRDVILSKAFMELSGTAVRVYLFFLNKRVMKPFEGGKPKRSGKGKYYVANNGEIQFTYAEAVEKYHIRSRGTFRDAIDQLVRVGLIDVAKTGMGLCKDVSLYAISERWKLYGTDEFVVKKRPKRRGGFGFSEDNTYGRCS